jgi:hypothetical protein
MSGIISWYSGCRGREYPLVFRFQGKEKRTCELVSMKIIEEMGTCDRTRAFLIRTLKGELFEILVGVAVQISPHIPP